MVQHHEGTASQNIHPDSSDKKRTTEFVGEILDMIDNACYKSIRCITCYMGVSKFFYQAGSA